MKNLKVLSMVVLCMATLLASCSGEDGEQGPKGNPGESIKGDPGLAGDDGDDGLSCWDTNNDGIKDDSEDINQDGEWNALDCQGEQGDAGDAGEPGDPGQDGNANVSQYFYDLNFNGFTLSIDLNDAVDVPENYAHLFYFEHNSGSSYFAPGNLFETNAVSMELNYDNELEVTFIFYNNGAISVSSNIVYPRLMVISIEITNTGKTSENVMADLKAAGVDTSDYHAVADYFGLDY